MIIEETGKPNSVFKETNSEQQENGEMPQGERQVCRLPTLSETAKKNLKTAGKVALGVGIVAVVAGGALLAYMHFSGLGINQAGFAALGAKIKAFCDATQTMSKGQVFLEVILPTVGGLGVTGLLIAKRKPIGHMINLQKEKYWKWAGRVWARRVTWARGEERVSTFTYHIMCAFEARATEHLEALEEKIESYNRANVGDLNITSVEDN